MHEKLLVVSVQTPNKLQLFNPSLHSSISILYSKFSLSFAPLLFLLSFIFLVPILSQLHLLFLVTFNCELIYFSNDFQPEKLG